jgi:acetoin utilization deacetylase AcuC-like enzyme
MKAFYSDTFVFPLPGKHRFPLGKYSQLRQRIVADGLVPPLELHVAPPATDEELLLAHEGAYLRRVIEGHLEAKEVRRIGLPWSPELVARARHSTGGTLAACRAALEEGVAANLAGGTHHAGYDWGQGYCLFNDVVVAARAVGRRALVIDCDVHQGNGTAALARGDPALFTFDVYCEHNFPLHKEPADLEVPLPEGTGDDDYLAALEAGVGQALDLAGADMAFYLAGADPYEGDSLGRLALSKAGLAARDRLVLARCRAAGLPVAVLMAGGYGRQVADTVEIHLATVRTAVEMAPGWPRPAARV